MVLQCCESGYTKWNIYRHVQSSVFIMGGGLKLYVF